MRTTLAILQPTLLVLFALTLLAGGSWLLFPPNSPVDADLVASSALGPSDLARLGAHRLVVPNPELSPAQVVETQLAGLANTSDHGLGILQCFCFASPANRAATGPLERFGAMVRQGDFACLARPLVTLVGTPRVSGGLARVLATVVDRDHRLHAFTFILSRQTEGPFDGCWMTEAVYPASHSLEERPAPPAKSEGDATGEI